MQHKATKNHLRIQCLCEGAILLALAVVLNYLSQFLFVNMPQGGSVTLAMFPILLFAHRWGVVPGLAVGFVYGLTDMLIGSAYAYGWQSILLDYLLAYTALGLGGFFKGKAWGIFPDVAIGCLGRYLVHHISGVTLYRILVPTTVKGLESLGALDNPHIYSLLYNGVYMLPNTVIALALAALLYAPMKKYFAGHDLRK